MFFLKSGSEAPQLVSKLLQLYFQKNTQLNLKEKMLYVLTRYEGSQQEAVDYVCMKLSNEKLSDKNVVGMFDALFRYFTGCTDKLGLACLQTIRENTLSETFTSGEEEARARTYLLEMLPKKLVDAIKDEITAHFSQKPVDVPPPSVAKPKAGQKAKSVPDIAPPVHEHSKLVTQMVYALKKYPPTREHAYVIQHICEKLESDQIDLCKKAHYFVALQQYLEKKNSAVGKVCIDMVFLFNPELRAFVEKGMVCDDEAMELKAIELDGRELDRITIKINRWAEYNEKYELTKIKIKNYLEDHAEMPEIEKVKYALQQYHGKFSMGKHIPLFKAAEALIEKLDMRLLCVSLAKCLKTAGSEVGLACVHAVMEYFGWENSWRDQAEMMRIIVQLRDTAKAQVTVRFAADTVGSAVTTVGGVVCAAVKWTGLSQ